MNEPTASAQDWMASTVEVMIMANPRNAHYVIAERHNAELATLVDALRKISATALYRDGYQAKEIADAALSKCIKK